MAQARHRFLEAADLGHHRGGGAERPLTDLVRRPRLACDLRLDELEPPLELLLVHGDDLGEILDRAAVAGKRQVDVEAFDERE